MSTFCASPSVKGIERKQIFFNITPICINSQFGLESCRLTILFLCKVRLQATKECLTKSDINRSVRMNHPTPFFPHSGFLGSHSGGTSDSHPTHLCDGWCSTYRAFKTPLWPHPSKLEGQGVGWGGGNGRVVNRQKPSILLQARPTNPALDFGQRGNCNRPTDSHHLVRGWVRSWKTWLLGRRARTVTAGQGLDKWGDVG